MNIMEKLDVIQPFFAGGSDFCLLAQDFNDRQQAIEQITIPFIDDVLANGTDSQKADALASFWIEWKALEVRRRNLAVYQARAASLVGGLLNGEQAAPMGELEEID